MIQTEVTVPGKIMLAGEYAVLQGGSTLSATVSGQLIVMLDPTEDDSWEVYSDLWDEPAYIEKTAVVSDFSSDPLKQATLIGRDLFDSESGLLRVKSKLDCKHGVGTSSALRLGVLLGMRAYSQNEAQLSDWDVGKLAVDLQRKSQPDASGYDVATQLIGGLIKLDFDQSQITPEDTIWYSNSKSLDQSCFESLKNLVHPFVGGTGAPTSETMTSTLEWISANKLMPEIKSTSSMLIHHFVTCFKTPSIENQTHLFDAVKDNREIFKTSPKFPTQIADALSNVSGCDLKWSFKTTGAGGEDAILLIGEKENLAEAIKVLNQLSWSPMPYEFVNDRATVERFSGETPTNV